MKSIIFLALISLAFAETEIDLKLKNIKINYTREFGEEFLKVVEDARAGGITAVVNEYADKILANIQTFAVHNGLDPVELPDLEQGFLTADITMNNGWLQGVSTIHRNGDVEASYSTTTKKLELSVPIEFDNLQFSYHYHLIILLIGPSGEVNGKITNLNAQFTLEFDFNEYQAKLESFTLTNTGHIDVTFSGNGLIDVVVNILSEFATTILHPLIVGIVEGIIINVLNGIVNAINSAVNGILHPTTAEAAITTVAQYILGN